MNQRSERYRRAGKREFAALLHLSNSLQFEQHHIARNLDARGHYAVPLDNEFPFHVSLFYFRSGEFTQGQTWHERLELFLPLDRPVRLQMGEGNVDLGPGDLLVVDNLKFHNVQDRPGLNTRVIVLSFRPEFVYSLGSPSCDYAFLLPFYAKVEGSPHILRAGEELAPPVYFALTELLECYFQRDQRPYFQAGCKASFLMILYQLARRFQSSEIVKSEFLQQQGRSRRLTSLFEPLKDNYSARMSVTDAARMVHMSESQFMRLFRLVSGMSFVAYVTHIRVSNALRLLQESDLSIAEIAAQVGFSDQSYFDRRFKQAFGKSPRQIRQT